MPIYRPNNSTPFLVQSPYGQKQAGDITGQEALPGQFAGGSTAEGGAETKADPNYGGGPARDPSVRSAAREEAYDPRTGAVAIRDTKLIEDRGTVDVKSPFGGDGFARKDLGQASAQWGGLQQQQGGEVSSAGSNITQKAPTVLNYVMANRGKEMGRAESLGLLSRSGIAGEEGLDRALEERKFGFTGEEQSADYGKWRSETDARLKGDIEKSRAEAPVAPKAVNKANLEKDVALHEAPLRTVEEEIAQLSEDLATFNAWYDADWSTRTQTYGMAEKTQAAMERLRNKGYIRGHGKDSYPAVRLKLSELQQQKEKLQKELDPYQQQYISLYGE